MMDGRLRIVVEERLGWLLIFFIAHGRESLKNLSIVGEKVVGGEKGKREISSSSK